MRVRQNKWQKEGGGKRRNKKAHSKRYKCLRTELKATNKRNAQSPRLQKHKGQKGSSFTEQPKFFFPTDDDNHNLPLCPLWLRAGWRSRVVLGSLVCAGGRRWRSCCGCGPLCVCAIPWFLGTAAVDGAGGLARRVSRSTPESSGLSLLLAVHQSRSQTHMRR